jgi:hypothetical protein
MVISTGALQAVLERLWRAGPTASEVRSREVGPPPTLAWCLEAVYFGAVYAVDQACRSEVGGFVFSFAPLSA